MPVLEAEIRERMWDAVGLVRTEAGLRAALARFEAIENQAEAGAAHRTRDLATVARLVATAALARAESRGAHFRADYPASDVAWRRRVLLQADGGSVAILTQEVAAEAAPVEVCA